MDTFSPDDFQQDSPNNPPTGIEAKQLRENRESHDQQQPDNKFNSQYTIIGDGTYLPCGKTVKKLIPGVYELGMTENGVPFFINHPTRSDEWLTFRDSLISNVLEEINKFWSTGDVFKQYGFLQRRGYLLYGPPGTGKTVLVKQIIDRIVKDRGIVILSNVPPSMVSKALQYLNKIEPSRQIVCVYEDIDAIIARWGEAELLALLDGEDSTDHVLNIATTNYPEKLDKRIISRPRRFDRIIKISYPDAEMRKFYFKHKMPDISDVELNDWVKNTDEFTFAALTELVISVKCLGNEVGAAIAGLKLLLGNKPNSSEYKSGGGSIGFKV